MRMINAKICRGGFFLSACITLFGCNVHPVYKVSPYEKTSSIKSLYGDSLKMCRGGNYYTLEADADSNIVKVPAGRKINIGSYMNFHGYNIVYSCMPFLSFIPKEGEVYVTDSHVKHGSCYIELVKEDPNSDTGLAVEPSIGKANCY